MFLRGSSQARLYQRIPRRYTSSAANVVQNTRGRPIMKPRNATPYKVRYILSFTVHAPLSAHRKEPMPHVLRPPSAHASISIFGEMVWQVLVLCGSTTREERHHQGSQYVYPSLAHHLIVLVSQYMLHTSLYDMFVEQPHLSLRATAQVYAVFPTFLMTMRLALGHDLRI